MAPGRQTPPAETMTKPVSRDQPVAAKPRGPGSLGTLLDGAIFFFFILFAILLPHSIKGGQRAWQIAFLLWLVKLAIEHRRPFKQPLSAPLLAYVTLSGISTALSPDPYLSWDRMKIVCLVLVGIVFAQNLKRLSQVRVLVFLLILSGVAAAGFTAWQYTYGVGMRVARIIPQSPLYRIGVHHDDILTRINGRSVHTPGELQRTVLEAAPGSMLRLNYLRGFPFQKHETVVTREDFINSGLGSSNLQFARGKPFRAQGTLGHYVVFAEILMQIGCMTWAMLLQTRRKQLRLLFGISFLGLTAALLLTETRAALAGLAVGCLAALLVLAGKRSRGWAASGLIVLAICSLFWIERTRGLHWIDRSDPGTNFRVLMWEDGLRLVREHPWFGVGMETARVHYHEWHIRGFELYHVQSHFHSTLLQIAVERGLLTLAAWLWFVVSYMVFLVRLLRKTRAQSRFATGAVTGVLAGLLAFGVTSVVHYNLGEEPLVMILFFYFGLAAAIEHILQEPGGVDVP
jgi:O-Antigen ligase/PDZ domain